MTPSELNRLAERVEAAPWDDCKIAFGIDDDEWLWDMWKANTLILPPRWSLDETDSSGCRIVAVFRVEGVPRIEDGEEVANFLREAASKARTDGGGR